MGGLVPTRRQVVMGMFQAHFANQWEKCSIIQLNKLLDSVYKLGA